MGGSLLADDSVAMSFNDKRSLQVWDEATTLDIPFKSDQPNLPNNKRMDVLTILLSDSIGIQILLRSTALL